MTRHSTTNQPRHIDAIEAAAPTPAKHIGFDAELFRARPATERVTCWQSWTPVQRTRAAAALFPLLDDASRAAVAERITAKCVAHEGSVAALELVEQDEADPTPDYNDDDAWKRIAETTYGGDRATPQIVDMLRLAWRAAPASARPAIAALGMRAVAALKEPDGVPGEEGGPGGDEPDDEAVLAALADFIRQVGDVIPDETATGKAFWRARSAAAARAAIQIAKGVRVTLLPNGDALVPSASGSAIYRYDDRARRCSCRAGAKGHGCWHVEAISATRAAQQVTA